MERTANTPVPEKVLWHKTGGGSLRLFIDGRKKLIKSDEKFLATEAEVPQAFRDVIIRAGGTPAAAAIPVKPVESVKTVYRLKSRGGGGWYDVISPDGKVLNETALKKDVAEQLKEDLEK